MSIAIKKLEFSYPNAMHSLTIDIKDWSVVNKEKHFLSGFSGCGKSTLLNLISGVLSPSKGEIYVLDQPLHQMKTRERDYFRANNIGYVFQQFNLIPYLSAVENIALANHFAKKISKSQLKTKIETLLSRLALHENTWHKAVNLLSVGQQQRIAIARALINQPKLLIADEPTSSLDQQSSEQFMSLLMTLCDEDDMTLLFVSHDTRFTHYFDHAQDLTLINSAIKSQPCL